MTRTARLALAAALLAAATLSAPAARAEGEAREHVVQKGDTLWDLSGDYLYDPFAWPRLWDHNRQIENPHLLQPGTRILLDVPPLAPGEGTTGMGAGGGETAPASVPAPPAEEPAAEFAVPVIPPAPEETEAAAPVPASPRREADRSLPEAQKQELLKMMATYGFLSEEGEVGLGSVVSEADGHQLLAPADKVEVRFDQGPHAAGEVYSIARLGPRVNHPRTGSSLGTLVRVFGEVRVTAIGGEGKEGTGEVIAVWGPAQAGDILLERVDYLSWIPRESAPPTLEREGVVVAHPDGATLTGEGEVVFIDLGTADGLAPGNVLSIVDDRYGPWDGPLQLAPAQTPAVGTLTVVAPRTHTSVARITTSTREVRTGAAVTAP